MFQNLRFALGATLVVTVLGMDARAQITHRRTYTPYGTGFSIEGEQEFGLDINSDRVMRWNQFLYESRLENERRRHLIAAGRRERNLQAYRENLERIRENPDSVDIARGDALNAVINQLSDPRLSPAADSSQRFYTSPRLDEEKVHDIPFQYAVGAVTISLHRLTAEYDWPQALKADAFSSERRAYQEAVEAALKEQDVRNRLEPAASRAIREAILKLHTKFEATTPNDDLGYLPAANFLKGLLAMSRMLENPRIAEFLADIQTHLDKFRRSSDRKSTDMTVADLVEFMLVYNLRFGAANTPRERAIYQELYHLMTVHRDEVLRRVGADASPTAVFQPLGWDRLLDNRPVPAAPQQP